MIALLLVVVSLAFAQNNLPDEVRNPMVVIGNEQEELTKPNSSHYIGKEKLKRQQDVDLNRAIKSVPGVYVREEDGYGLRPNISLRGTNPDRSKKVNFMEDGTLIGPAPYSAPAAYFTPSMFHVDGLEVFKGVATVIYGPNSVGGTIHFLTPEAGPGWNSFVEAGFGNFDYRKIMGRVTYGSEKYSGVLTAAFHETSGFKELPGGGNTGFEQADFLTKHRVRVRGGDNPHYLDLKLGYTIEESNETYLGLAENDFYANPYRRYEASRLDNMQWNHQTYQAGYTATLNASSSVTATAYSHNFDRTWYRFERFNSGTSVRDVLNDTAANQDLYEILKGEQDSAVLPGGAGDILIARNKRLFFNRGLILQHNLAWGRHDVQWGVRYHEDQIQRHHDLDRYSMVSGRLVMNGPRVNADIGQDTSWAKTVFLKDEIDLGQVRLTLAARYETVETEASLGQAATYKNDDSFLVPGAGAVWSFVPYASVFVGANKGYAPVGPGQNKNVKPEESNNYELGLRYARSVFFEAIGFFNDYQNIKGLCSFSAGCAALAESEEFNGGKAKIYGVESRARYDLYALGAKFPFELNYTYTSAKFDSEFTTQSQEWGSGLIRKGSPLPYVPEHQYSFMTGVEIGRISSDVRFVWTGRQWDQAAETGRKEVRSYGVVDWNTKYKFKTDTFAYFKIDNVMDNEYIVSYRPVGARPGKARTFFLGFRQSF